KRLDRSDQFALGEVHRNELGVSSIKESTERLRVFTGAYGDRDEHVRPAGVENREWQPYPSGRCASHRYIKSERMRVAFIDTPKFFLVGQNCRYRVSRVQNLHAKTER